MEHIASSEYDTLSMSDCYQCSLYVVVEFTLS